MSRAPTPLTYLVTGSSGYIGANLCAALLEQGSSVIGLDRSPSKFERVNFRAVEVDLADLSSLESVILDEQIDGIFHLAALASVPDSFNLPSEYMLANILATQNLLTWIRAMKITNLIFASTCSLFKSKSGLIEELSVKGPINPYATSKLIGEKLISDFAQDFPNFRFGIARFFNVARNSKFGYKENFHSSPRVIQSLIKSVQSGEIFTMNGNDFDTPDGSAVRDYIHVDDVIDGLLAISRFINQHPSDDFNLGLGTGILILELKKMVETAYRQEILLKVEPRRAGDPAQLVSNSEKVKRLTTFRPKQDAAKSIIDSYKQELTAI